MPKTLPILPVWTSWKELTQFLALSDHVLISQHEQWRQLPIPNKPTIKILRQDGPYKFETDGETYEKILADRHVLASVVLLNSYALVESAVRQIYELLISDLSVNTPLLTQIRAAQTSITDTVKNGGIEAWGTRILTDLGRDWSYVETGKTGLVEVAIVRNAIAHGEANVNQSMVNRVNAVGGNLPWNIGSPIRLDIARVKEYRHRLRSFARVVEHGAEELYP
ncbi:hypothetical protein [Aeromonas dhakensis]|uniref:hypothetical protein n=1 Tax=Aeromonas dhakensis TaxID=196024 RepID=UPI003985C975